MGRTGRYGLLFGMSICSGRYGINIMSDIAEATKKEDAVATLGLSIPWQKVGYGHKSIMIKANKILPKKGIFG